MPSASFTHCSRTDRQGATEDDCHAHISEARAIAEPMAAYAVHAYSGAALGLLHLGSGRNEDAISALTSVAAFVADYGLGEPAVVQWAPDLVEAYVRQRRPGAAERVLATFARQATRTGRTWALAAAARCRGLLATTNDEANACFGEALEWHDHTPTPFERARTLLCWGERLRRSGQRSQARVRLRAAMEVFEGLGAVPWAERARAELSATGARLRRQGTSTAPQLTAQELQIALSVTGGMTNREAAAALFLSPKTVEFHLSNVYRKLNVRSRTELTRLAATGVFEH